MSTFPPAAPNPNWRAAHGLAGVAALLLAAGIGEWLTAGLLTQDGPWLASGVLLALLLASPRQYWYLWLIAHGLSTLAVAYLARQPVLASLLTASGAVLGVLLGAVLIRATWRVRHVAAEPRALLILFGGGVLLGGAASAVLVALAHWWVGDGSWLSVRRWFTLQALGACLLVPAALSLHELSTAGAPRLLRGRLPSLQQGVELVGVLGGLAVSAGIVFATPPEMAARLPLYTYVTTPFLLWAALRFGVRGTSTGCLLLSLIAVAGTARGLGPYSVIDRDPVVALLQLNQYLLVISLIALTAAAFIGDRERALNDARAWRGRFEAAIAAAGELFYVYRPKLGTLEWSGDTVRILGVPSADLARLGDYLFRIHIDDRERVAVQFEGLASGERPGDIEYRIMHPDGRLTVLEDRGAPLSVGDNRQVIGFLRDITAARATSRALTQLEGRLAQVERTQALGRLAGAVAHDFNNILGSVLGFGGLLQDRLRGAAADIDPQVLWRYADAIVAAGERGRDLVDQVFAYSRNEQVAHERVSLSAVVNEVALLLQGSIDARTRLHTHVVPGLSVRGSPIRLHQLVMNLASNALRAMPEGGTLGITLAEVEVPSARAVSQGVLLPGHYLELGVSDTGGGMSVETQARMFDPWFTTAGDATRPSLSGIGLGLSIVKAACEEHAGLIDVHSEVGQGTRFTVFLPAAGRPAARESAGAGQVIMVVDDEAQMRAFAEDLLAELGYEPVGFADPKSALAALATTPARFDAVLTDEIMPGMTGTALAAAAHAIAPGLPVLVASGYTGAGFEARAVSAGIVAVLRKPYASGDVQQALAKVFGG
jgi:PAS domain S-box-containing protein